MNDVGPLIRRLREGANESLRELGAALKKHHTTVWGWENGTAEPSLRDLQRVAQRYRVKFTIGPYGLLLGYMEA